MQGDLAVLLCADDAAHGDQLDGAGQLDGIAVGVQARLVLELLRVEEAAALQAADGGDNHTMSNAVLRAELFQSQHDVLARLKPDRIDILERTLCKFHTASPFMRIGA